MLATHAPTHHHQPVTERSDAFVQSPFVRLRVVRQGGYRRVCLWPAAGVGAWRLAGGSGQVRAGQKRTLCPPTPPVCVRGSAAIFPHFFKEEFYDC